MGLLGKVFGGNEREWIALVVWVVARVVEKVTGLGPGAILPIHDGDFASVYLGFAGSRAVVKGAAALKRP